MKRRITVGIVLAAVVATALVIVGVGGASRASGRRITVPAATMNNGLIETLKVTVKAPRGRKAAPPRLKATNLSALGPGYGGVAAVQGPTRPGRTATYLITLVQYMGNRSTNPPTTLDLTLSPPKNDPKAQTGFNGLDEALETCKQLDYLNTSFEGTSTHQDGNATEYLEDYVPANASDKEAFLDSIVDLKWGSCPGSPEAWDQGAD